MRRTCWPLTVAVMVAVMAAGTAAAADEDPNVWKMTAKLSYAKTGGNTDTETLAGTVESLWDLTPSRYVLRGGVLYSTDDNDTTANRWSLLGRYERDITARLFGTFTADYLKDRFAGYDHRLNAGPGLGYTFLDSQAHKLKGLASVLLTYDKFEDGGEDTYTSGRAGAEYLWQISERVSFKEDAGYQVSFADTSVYFLKSKTELDVKANSILSLGVGFVVNYQNEPPGDAKSTDTIFYTSLGVELD